MPNVPLQSLNAAGLRRELSLRNLKRAQTHAHEVTYGRVPNFVFRELNGVHGNFQPASYRAILLEPDWARRLRKGYTAGRWIARRWEHERCELDCANSSDALLMNIFCHPGVLARPSVCGLMGIEANLRPQFGFKPRIPLVNGRTDQTEIDMALGSLLVEAKLTEGGFQTAPLERLMRYRGFEDEFDIAELPRAGSRIRSYQLIRGVLAASALERGFAVLCDGRRKDLIEQWFQIMKAVRRCDLRSRLALLTWQELAEATPKPMQHFLNEKYGIRA